MRVISDINQLLNTVYGTEKKYLEKEKEEEKEKIS